MLSSEEIQEIEKEFEQVPYKKAAAIEALKIVQHHRGWISDESLYEIAAYVGISPEELESVATFYNLIFRKPVGRHIILLCDSVSCFVIGYQTLYEYLKEHLHIKFGETTQDGRFTLLPNACLGTCDHAPAMMINSILYQDLTIEKLEKILDEHK